MNKKYQVFISSTFTDLTAERQTVLRTVLDLGHIPSGMEIFPAADIEQFEYIKKVIDECDYYVLIIGARYGSVDAAGVSFTEKEYDYAVERKKTVLAFIHGDPGSIAVNKVDTDPALAAKLNAFREKVSNGRLVRYWKSAGELEPMVIKALVKAFNDMPGTDWIRGDAAASEDLLVQNNNLRNLAEDQARQEGLEKKQFTRVVASGTNQRIGFFYALNPDCSASGDVKIRVTKQPEHGSTETTTAINFPNYPKENIRSKCNDHKVRGMQVNYKSAEKYVGSDELELLVLFPAGFAWEVRYNIDVR